MIRQLAVVGAFAMAISANAATISYDFSGAGDGQTTDLFTLPGFDSSLGSLQEIIIETSGKASFSVADFNLQPGNVEYTLNSSQGLYFDDIDIFDTGPGHSLVGDGTETVGDDGSFFVSVEGSGGKRNYKGADFLSFFIDMDVDAYFLTDTAEIQYSQFDLFEIDSVDPDFASGMGKITYVYTDPRNTVPEPASWALMVGGFGLVGGMLRHRRPMVRFG